MVPIGSVGTSVMSRKGVGNNVWQNDWVRKIRNKLY